jgi:hypothetical protein
MSTTSAIYYETDSLVIKIRTGSPAAFHHLLLRGLATSLKLQIQRDERIDEDVDGLVALSDVLSKIIPSEMHLIKAYENESPAA